MNTILDMTRSVALRSIEIMADGGRPDFDKVVVRGAVNHEGATEPPACRAGGPEGFHATAVWLRAAFADLNHRVEHVVAEGGLVVVDTTMSGRHVGPFVLYDSQGAVETAWAPTGKTFAVRQSHWLRVADGLVTEHWAVRDDLGQSCLQGGFQRPSQRDHPKRRTRMSSRRVLKGPGRRPMTDKRRRFQELLEEGWSLAGACREVGVGRSTGHIGRTAPWCGARMARSRSCPRSSRSPSVSSPPDSCPRRSEFKSLPQEFP